MSRSIALWLSLILLQGGAAVGSGGVSDYVVDDEAELLVDDVLIAARWGVTRELHACTKLPEPVVEPDRPWQSDRVYIAGTVYYDENRRLFEMWYNGGGTCYATSRDGIKWEKPVLGLREYRGSRENNIVYERGCQTVLYDEHTADASKRYKMLGAKGHNHIWGAYSPDGKNWTGYENDPLIPFGSEVAKVIWDDRREEYVCFVRPYLPKPVIKELKNRRLVATTRSRDFVNWEPMQLIVVPDAEDDQWARQPQERTEFYDMAGFRYGSQYLGLLQVFQITEIYPRETKLPKQSTYEGPIETQLVHSRDGVTWTRYEDRRPIIPRGAAGYYDAGAIMFAATQPVLYGDEVWHYYTAINTTHGGPLPPKRITIGLAKWRRDGYVSLNAHTEPGLVETIPVTLAGNRLIINADAADGEIRVALLAEEGDELAGYTLADCEPITVDQVAAPVRWRGKETLATSGKVRIRFAYRQAKLYSFWVE